MGNLSRRTFVGMAGCAAASLLAACRSKADDVAEEVEPDKGVAQSGEQVEPEPEPIQEQVGPRTAGAIVLEAIARRDEGEQGTTPFGGAAFTFGCDGSSVRIPCTYDELVAGCGLEARDLGYAPDPNADPAYDGNDYQDSAFLFLPDSENFASAAMYVSAQVIGEDGLPGAYLLDGDRHVFEANRYGDCPVYRVSADFQGWDLEKDVTRYEFAGGIRLGMTRDEVYGLLGEPARTYGGDLGDDAAEFCDGCQRLTVGFNDRGAWVIEMLYDPFDA